MTFFARGKTDNLETSDEIFWARMKNKLPLKCYFMLSEQIVMSSFVSRDNRKQWSWNQQTSSEQKNATKNTGKWNNGRTEN